jgi:hypothetical protein
MVGAIAQLPDVPASPVANPPPLPKFMELAQPTTKTRRLADVDHRTPGEPPFPENRRMDGRVSALESTARIDIEKDRIDIAQAKDDVDAGRVWNATFGELREGDEALEPFGA